MEEHEQFNRGKIVASVSGGDSYSAVHAGRHEHPQCNELAHNYLNMLTHEDRQRLTQIIQKRLTLWTYSPAPTLTRKLACSLAASKSKTWRFACWWMFARVKMEEFTGHGAGAGTSQPVEIHALPPSAMNYVLRYWIIGNLDLPQTKRTAAGPTGRDGDEQLSSSAVENHQRYSRLL